MNIRRITCLRGNPTPEEQAVIAAFVLSETQKKGKEKPLKSPWTQTARTESLNRWPAAYGDRRWQS